MSQDCLVYSDIYITQFVDTEKCLTIFVNDRGQTQVINVDSNFYSAEDNVVAYYMLIKHATDDADEQKEFLGRYLAFVESEIKDTDTQISYDYLRGADLPL